MKSLQKLLVAACVSVALPAMANVVNQEQMRQLLESQAQGGGLNLSAIGSSDTDTRSIQQTPAGQARLRALPATTTTNNPQALLPLPTRQADSFEQLASAIAGQELRYFGDEIFKTAQLTGLPSELPAAADYVLGPGDKVSVRIWGQLDADLEAAVDASGNIFVPKVGNVRVNGLLLSQAEGALRAAVARLYRNFDIAVGAGGVRNLPVTVVGLVNYPGVHNLNSNASVLSALLMAGGPKADGSLRQITLRRANGSQQQVDLYQLLLSGNRGSDSRLQPGDVIVVPPAGVRVGVGGGVMRPAIYELLPGNNLADAIELAGGTRREADVRFVTLDRLRPQRGRIGQEVTQNDLSRLNVQDGDIVVVPTVAARYDASVSLRGHVSQTRRLEWTEGLRVMDLIGSVERLQTHNFWDKRELIKPKQDNQLNQLNQTEAQIQQIKAEDDAKIEDPLMRLQHSTINWDYATIERLDPTTLGVELLSFNLRRALQGNESDNLLLQAGDIVTLYSTADFPVPKEKQPRYVRITGEVATPGLYRVEDGETLADLIVRVGGLTADAYLFGINLSRVEVQERQRKALNAFLDRQEQMLEQSISASSSAALNPADISRIQAEADAQRRLLQKLRNAKPEGRVVLGMDASYRLRLDDLPMVALENGDSIIIPSVPSTVAVGGEVFNPGDFLVGSRRIGDYLERSGGATESGDLSEAFVLRADGTVVARKQRRYALGVINIFSRTTAMPGDSVFVPPKLDRTPFLRNLRDISQVFAQFGLGAAAIKTIRD